MTDLAMCLAGVAMVCAAAAGAMAGQARAQDEPSEIRLTEAQVKNMIEAMKAPYGRFERELEEARAEFAKSPDEKSQAEFKRKRAAVLEAFAKAYGFSSQQEYDEVFHTLDRIAEVAKAEVGRSPAVTAIRLSIAKIEGATHLSADQKQQATAGMRHQLERLTRSRFPENVELYKRMQPKIDAAQVIALKQSHDATAEAGKNQAR